MSAGVALWGAPLLPLGLGVQFPAHFCMCFPAPLYWHGFFPRTKISFYSHKHLVSWIGVSLLCVCMFPMMEWMEWYHVHGVSRLVFFASCNPVLGRWIWKMADWMDGCFLYRCLKQTPPVKRKFHSVGLDLILSILEGKYVYCGLSNRFRIIIISTAENGACIIVVFLSQCAQSCIKL